MRLPQLQPLNILIVRVSSLGDVLHNMPMVADILRHLPHAQIDWVVEEAYTQLVQLNPGVRSVLPLALRRWRKSLTKATTRAEIAAFRRGLRKQAYDIVFDTQGLLKTGLIMGMARLSPGGRRVGLANRTEGSSYEGLSRLFHTESVPIAWHTHAVERGRLVAAAALGYTVDSPADFNLHPSALTQRPDWMPAQPYAVFFHATSVAAKEWLAAGWVALAHDCAQRGIPVLLPWGSAAEHSAAVTLAAQMTNATVLPRLPMMDAVLLAQHAALVIGVDTGLMHVAAAFCRPTVGLYVASTRWRTEATWSPRIINLGQDGQPPGVDEVRQAMAALL